MLSKNKGATQKRGIAYEKKKVRDHGRKHIGGPGKPDAPGMEVKDWQKPVPRSEVVRAKRKGINKFVNKGGFTGPAVEYAKKTKMKLYKGKKKLT